MASFAYRIGSLVSRIRTGNPFTSITRSIVTSRTSAIKESLLRALRTEISHVSDRRSPSRHETSFESFSIDHKPGENWFRLTRSDGSEEIKIDSSMVDGFAPSTRSGDLDPQNARLHMSLAVEVARSDSPNGIVMQFICSAWPDAMDIERVFAAPRGLHAIKPYMGPHFKDLDEEMQNAALDYLEERGVTDELAAFLHKFVAHKNKTEHTRWLRNIESYVKK